jgi:6-pyruvoyltetrahydropterin/6-carboxytetrahydropterin synthase
MSTHPIAAEPHRFVITVEDRIEAAHQLNLPYESKCNRKHGHCYRLRVAIGAEALDANGMVIDFAQIRAALRTYDHQDLNDFFSPSTAEKFAEVLLDQLQELVFRLNERARVLEVGVGETATTMVVCRYART